MAVAYVILAHNLPDHLARLVWALYHTDDLFLVHIDAKARPGPFREAIEQRHVAATNIEFLAQVRCDWAGFGHVEATLKGIDRVLEQGGFTHIVLLTGQDYPIKPLDHIRTHFATHEGRSFISWSAGDDPIPENRRGNERWYWDGNLARLERRHYLFRGRWVGVPNRFIPFIPPRRRMPLGLRPYQGLAYWSLSIEAGQHVRRLISDNPSVIRFFRRVWGCDEFFFQMILLNSTLAPSLVNEDLRFMTWEGYHPLTIRSSDLGDLARSSKFFAR